VTLAAPAAAAGSAVQDVYPLSPMQEGMLFHTLYDPEGAVYFEQFRLTLTGEVDAGALERAWRRAIVRHPILRTAFVWEGVKRPHQVVLEAAPFALERLDWSGLAGEERRHRLDEYLEADRRRGFDLTAPPLMRLTLIGLGGDRHWLVWRFHHLLLDGWSGNLLLGEVFTLYEAFREGREVELPARPPFRRYVAWLRRQDPRAAESFWRRYLAGFTRPTPLTVDRRRAGEAGYAKHLAHLSRPLTADLRELARTSRLTLNALLQGAWALLLSRYSGSSDVLFGATSSGRPADLPGVQEMVGLFVNTLPARVAVAEDGPLVPWLERLQVAQAEVRQYEHVALTDIQGWSELPPGEPLFDSIQGLENYAVGAPSGSVLRSLRITELEAVERTNYPLTVLGVPGDALAIEVWYELGRFDRATVQRLQGHLGALLTGFVREPGRALGGFSLLTPRERRQVVAEWNDTARPVDDGDAVEGRILAWAERTPGAAAVAAEDGDLSYGELAAGAVALARHLRSLGVGPESLVGVAMERSRRLPVALLGVLATGAAYVPLDPAYPRERLEAMVAAARPPVVVTEERLLGPPQGSLDRPLAGALAEALTGSGSCLVLLDRLPPPPAAAGSAVPAAAAGSLAYVIFTSGSTGRPKGIAVSRRSLANLTRSFRELLALAPADRLLMIPSLSFDASVGDLFPTLTAGATLVLHPDPARLSGEEMARFCARRGVSVLDIPAAFWRQLVASLAERPEAAGALERLRLVIAGGESISVREVASWAGQLGGATRFFGPYGPTEATVCATAYLTVDASELPPEADRLPIGRPLPNTRVHLLDRRLRPVPVAVPGEIHLGGTGLARGYLEPAETAALFVPDPHAGEVPGALPGGRLYRTGDLARWRGDGELEFVGRRDAQVKVRGFRIEPQEIEAVLGRHPGVREAVVLARATEAGGPRLTAFVVAEPDAGDGAGGEGAEQVDRWRLLFDQTYGEASGPTSGETAPVVDPELDFQGWSSSYTGEPIPVEEMRLWADSTVARILGHGAATPRRVLEIGCGTGLLLLRLARRCDLCCGTDFSPIALAALERALAAEPRRAEVRLAAAPADDLSAFSGERFDAVVLNSVAQYFPSVDYLLRVLERAVEAVAPGGFVFLGDLRSRRLDRAFHTSVELAAAASDTPRAELSQRVARRLAGDEELTLDPALFAALESRWPRVGAAEVLLKRGRFDNELVRFRYDVVLHLDAGGGMDAADREARVADGLLNARTAAAVRAADLLAAADGSSDAGALLRAAAGAPDEDNDEEVEPEDLLASFASDPERLARATPSPRGPDRFAVVIAPRGPLSTAAATGAGDDGRPWAAYGNDPLRARRERRLVPELRRFLAERLPEYMVPAAFALLDRLPVTPNGKADRAALAHLELPPSAVRRDEETPYVAPRNDVEERLAAIWGEVLGVERVGVEDDFFALGGHSLLATQVVSRLRAAFGVELPIRRLFEAPTVAGLARELGGGGTRGSEAPAPQPPPPLVARPRSGPVPLSFAQERLWFLDQLEGPSAQYNMPAALALSGDLRLPALARALDEVVRRHEVLRTTFGAADGRPFQVVHAGYPQASPRWPLVDLSRLAGRRGGSGAGDGALADLARREARRPFDLARGPLARATVVRRGPGEHVLLLTLHHAVADGWSMGVLVRELSALYAAFAAGRPSPLPDLAVQYADFALWQREWLQGAAMEERLAYWLERLDGLPPSLDLPTDRPRPAVLSSRGGHRPLRLPAALAAGLDRLARRSGATPFMTVLAGFAALLHRYGGQDDLALGTPVAARNRLELEPLIGVFVNTLVLRLHAGGDPAFGSFLEQARRHTLDAQAHEDVPFERLVDALDPERDLARNPLVQVMVSLQSLPREEIELPGLRLRPGPAAETGAAQLDLSLTLAEGGDGIAGSLEYAADLFDAATVDRMAGHLVHLLSGAVARPETPLSALPLMDEAERRRLLAWGAPADTAPAAACVPVRFARQAALTPDAVALEAGERRLTYRELSAAAHRLASRLRSLGAGPDRRVAVRLERSPELVVALLGVLEAGAAYVPVDPEYPPARQRRMLEDAGPVAVLCDPADVLTDEGTGEGEGWEPASAAPPDALAYVIYTSGSTGTPKGVGVSHRSLATYVETARAHYGIAAGDRVLQVASVSFDASVEEIFPALVTGATVVLRPPGPPGPVAELLTLCRRREVTVLPLPTVYWHEIARDPAALEIPESLRLVILGGEEARADRVAAWRREVGRRVRLANTYGPTEATVVATSFEAGAGPDRPRVPIGRPLGHVRAVVLDPRGAPQPTGVPGQLWLGGGALARGYLGHPARTAESFAPDPFAAAPGARLYATGDRARWLADGELEFLGRADHQVKVRGFRVEPGEIEAALRSAPGVREAAVTVARGSGQLAAWVAGGDLTPAGDDLRRFLAERLPAFMVPAAVTVLPELPRTAAGKIDRRRLAERSPEPRDRGCRTAPQSAAERALAAVWSQVLGVPEVGLEDDFFELGGDSISSLQVVARARQVGLALEPRQLFQERSLGALAAAARPVEAPGTGDAADPHRVDPVVGEAALTPIQHWFFELPVPARDHWNQAVLLALEPRAVPALAAALARLLAHHEALRLRFHREGATWRAACAAPTPEPPLTRVDLSRIPDGRRRPALEAAAVLAQRSLDLAGGPILRAVCFHLGDDDPRLLLTAHHLAVDGVSWRTLLEDLEALLTASGARRPPTLPARTTSWPAWSRRLRRHAATADLQTEAAFWRALSARAAAASGSGPALLDPGIEAETEELRTALDPEATGALLQEAPAHLHAGMEELLLAALALAFARRGRQSLVLELEGHGREAPFEGVDLTRTVGWFTTLFPLVLELPERLDPAGALRLAKVARRSVPGGGLGYGLLRYLGPDRDLASELARVAPEVGFNYLGQLDRALPGAALLRAAPERPGPVHDPAARRSVPLEVDAGVAGGRLQAVWRFTPRHLGRAEAESLAAAFTCALRELAELARLAREGPSAAVPSDFPLAGLDAPGLERLLAGRPPVADVHPLIPAQQTLLAASLEAGGGMYVTQLSCELAGPLDQAAFRRAWDEVVARHPALRAAFAWRAGEPLHRPLQVVSRRVEVPWHEEDWRGLEPAEEERRLEAYLAADRSRGFDLARAPLLRLGLIRLAGERHRFTWTDHHLLLDGWSSAEVLREVLALYRAAVSGEPARLPPPLPFRDLVARLLARDPAPARAFWQRELAGLPGPTRLPADGDPAVPEAERWRRRHLALDRDLTSSLRELARAQGVTLNTVVQGAWGLLLAHLTGCRDLVFGMVTAGRPVEPEGQEGKGTRLGMAADLLPRRLRTPPEAHLGDWLRAIQERQAELVRHAHTPSGVIHEAAGVDPERPLFDCLFTFENYPFPRLDGPAPAAPAGGLAIRDLRVFETHHHALSALVVPGDHLAVELLWDARRIGPGTVDRAASRLAALLAETAADPERTLGEVAEGAGER
jgi:amino acid adenylation domain-containing protein/non-ribosomal peptide synthase protein (TIGR01720 family)